VQGGVHDDIETCSAEHGKEVVPSVIRILKDVDPGLMGHDRQRRNKRERAGKDCVGNPR
jgi:hypothetical protein